MHFPRSNHIFQRVWRGHHERHHVCTMSMRLAGLQRQQQNPFGHVFSAMELVNEARTKMRKYYDPNDELRGIPLEWLLTRICMRPAFKGTATMLQTRSHFFEALARGKITTTVQLQHLARNAIAVYSKQCLLQEQQMIQLEKWRQRGISTDQPKESPILSTTLQEAASEDCRVLRRLETLGLSPAEDRLTLLSLLKVQSSSFCISFPPLLRNSRAMT
jgi:hypothetical protein